ncbi:MAG: response regulator [Deltaproteobacteria bacterium]|nr:response regulator [Deltaproteobacteria bacterium]
MFDRPFTILLVDDEERLLRALARQLRGYHVLVALDARSAFAQLESTPVDLVLTDNDMPGMSGVELLEAVKARFPRVVRGLMSALEPRELASLEARRTVELFLEQPFVVPLAQQLEGMLHGGSALRPPRTTLPEVMDGSC